MAVQPAYGGGIGGVGGSGDTVAGPIEGGAERPDSGRERLKRRDIPRATVFTAIIGVILAAFLSPLLRAVAVSLRQPEQVGQLDSPQWPAVHATYLYQGKSYDVYEVPIDNGIENLALVKKGRESSDFVDPSNPAAGTITWQGSWRTLSRAWSFAPDWDNYAVVWDQINYPRLLFNTVALAIIETIGTVLS